MSLIDLLHTSNRHCARFNSQYQLARVTNTAFAPYETVGAILTALDLRADTSETERCALLAVVLDQNRLASHPLWQGILLHAFEPMLRRLRSQLRDGDPLELDQLVLTGFVEAIDKTPAWIGPEQLAVTLWRLTSRAVFRELTADRVPPGESFDENLHTVPQRRTVCDERKLPRSVQADPDGELLSTIAGEENLSTYVSRLHPSLSEGERRKAYLRLQRRRHRALSRIRRELVAA